MRLCARGGAQCLVDGARVPTDTSALEDQGAGSAGAQAVAAAALLRHLYESLEPLSPSSVELRAALEPDGRQTELCVVGQDPFSEGMQCLVSRCRGPNAFRLSPTAEETELDRRRLYESAGTCARLPNRSLQTAELCVALRRPPQAVAQLPVARELLQRGTPRGLVYTLPCSCHFAVTTARSRPAQQRA